MGTYRERLRTNLNHRGHLKSPHKCHFHHGERWLKSLCLGLMCIRRFQGTYLIWELVINQGRIPKGILLFLSSFHSVDNISLVCVLSHSVMSDSATPRTVAWEVPLSMGISRQEYWSGLPCYPPGDLPNPKIELRSPALQADSLLSEPPRKPNTFLGTIKSLLRLNQRKRNDQGRVNSYRILSKLQPKFTNSI